MPSDAVSGLVTPPEGLLGRPRPFAYRGAVYRLLGAPPPIGRGLGAPPPLPLPAFRYHVLRPDVPYPEPPAPVGVRGEHGPEPGGRSVDGEARRPVAGKPERPAGPGAGDPGIHDSGPRRAVSTREHRVERAREDAPLRPAPVRSDPNPRDELEAPVSGMAVEGPSPGARRTPPGERSEATAGTPAPEGPLRLSVPGLTERRAFFASLTGPGHGTEELGPASRLAPESPSGPSSPPKAEPAGVASTPPPPSSPAVRRSAPARLGGSAIVDGSPSGSSGSTEARHVPPPRLAGQKPPEPRPRALSPTRQVAVQADVGFRARRRSADEVEHLRRAVTELAARRSAARAEESSGGRKPVPAPPRPEPERRVVMVRSALRPSPRVPRSFWSSSILRSGHLRPLR